MDLPQSDSGNRKFGVAHRVGRLVEGWANRFDNVADVVTFGMEAARAISEARGRILICTDYGSLQSLHYDVVPAFLGILRRANWRLERAALLVPRAAPMLRKQMEDLIEEANHPYRRLCEDGADAKAWLCSLMTTEERERLDEFLRERSRAQSVPALRVETSQTRISTAALDAADGLRRRTS